jgi:hypothetical protein
MVEFGFDGVASEQGEEAEEKIAEHEGAPCLGCKVADGGAFHLLLQQERYRFIC